MFQGRFALAAASALILSGCAAGPWQRAPNHPADPGAAPGLIPPVTAMERYRAGVAPAGETPAEDVQPRKREENRQ